MSRGLGDVYKRQLQKVLKDEKKLRELYQDMESPELEDLIQQGIYLSHLIGRSMD